MVQGSLAHRLRVLRAERGLTLREAASLTGVAKETISDIERGLRHPHDPTLAKIAKGYGVPVGDLLEEPALAVGKAEAPDQGQPESSEAPYIDAKRIAPILNEVAEAVEDEVKKDVHVIERAQESGLPQSRYPGYHKIAQRLADERGWPLEAAQALVALMHVESTYGSIPDLRRRLEEAYHGTPEYRRRQAQAEREEPAEA